MRILIESSLTSYKQTLSGLILTGEEAVPLLDLPEARPKWKPDVLSLLQDNQLATLETGTERQAAAYDPDALQRHIEELAFDPARGTVCYVADEQGTQSDWFAAALAYAYLRRCPLTVLRDNKTLTLDSQNGPLILVGKPQQLTNGLFHSIWQQDPERRRPIGLITGHTVSAALDLIFKGQVYPALAAKIDRNTLFTMIGEEFASPGAAEDNLYHPWSDATYDRLASQVSSQPFRMWNAMLHGRDDMIWLNNTLVCSKGSEPGEPSSSAASAAREDTHRLPACHYTGECYRPDLKLIPIEQFQSLAMFVNTCSSFKLTTSLFHTDFSMALRAVGGWAGAYIASPYMVDGRPFQNLLFEALMRTGTTVAEAVSLVDRMTLNARQDMPSTLILGDPLLTLAPETRDPIPVHDIRAESGQQEIELRTDGRACLILNIQGWNPEQIALTGSGKLKDNIYYSFLREGENIRLYLLSHTRLPETLRLTLHGQSLVTTLSERLVDLKRFIQNIQDLKIRFQNVDKAQKDLIFHQRNVENEYGDAQYRVLDHKKWSKHLNRLADIKRPLFEEVMEYVLNKTQNTNFQVYEEYKPYFSFQAPQLTGANCGDCGDGLHQYTLQALFNPEHVRHARICPTCGIVSDTDANLPVELTIGGETALATGQSYDMELDIRNRTGQEQTVLVGVGFILSKYNPFEAAGPQWVTVPPHAAVKATFRCRVGDTIKPHHYWAKAYALAGPNLGIATQNIWVRP